MSIVIKNLCHTYMNGSIYEKRALDNINIKIKDGEYVGIIGHTGSGKSTLIQHLNGLIKVQSGCITINDIDINKKNLKEIRKQVGLVFQYPEHQIFEESVKKDIAFGLIKQGLENNAIDSRIQETIKLLGIDEEILDKSPFELSGGQKRKVAIAGVLCMKPQILILDEPTAGLDPKGRDEIYNAITKYRNENNSIVILVSHSMEDIAKYVDRIIVMNKGTVEMDGRISEIYGRCDRLEEIGLSVPQITKFLRKLKVYNSEINDNIFTVKDAVNELIKHIE